MCLMFDMSQMKLYEKKGNRVTRAADGYKFDYSTAYTGVYSKSPFYVGANMWNKLPINMQNLHNKDQFKRELRDHIF